MMDHIRMIDWSCPSDTGFFVTEEVMKNSTIEKILQNRFRDPDISSDSEDENNLTDWDTVLGKNDYGKTYHRLFIPGLRANPPFPKLSTLTEQQHLSCLAVLCAEKPSILPDEFMARPTKVDFKVFEEVKETYLKEQQEYIAWAKTLWTNGQCVRALRPKPEIENVYEAEFKVRGNQMVAYPKVFEVAAQIELDGKGQYEMVPMETLLSVNTMKLPKVSYPPSIKQRLTVLRPCLKPEPCEMHPVRFVLPGESTPSILPVTEVHAELARFAAARGAALVAREGALRCLAGRRAWTLPVSVCAVPGTGGETVNVLVLGSEFSNKPEDVFMRTFRAYRRLLEHAFVPPSEILKWASQFDQSRQESFASNEATLAANDLYNPWLDNRATNDDDDENRLFIDIGETEASDNDNEASKKEAEKRDKKHDEPDERGTPEGGRGAAAKKKEKKNKQDLNNTSGAFGGYKCSCKGTIFEHPPPRSFRKWRFKNNTTKEHLEVLVHCAHKYKGPSGEVLLEPICEYQADLGASQQREDRLRSTALSLALRQGAADVVNVRIDTNSGDVITIEELSRDQLKEVQSPERLAAVQNAIYTALVQLQGLLPGHYVLMHEVIHGDNALLYTARDTGDAQQLRLVFEAGAAEPDVARTVRTPPALAPVLLPWHKFRKTLPCSFTYHANMIAKETKKQPAKQRTPPQAIKLPDAAGDQRRKWPKKKGGKKKRR